jgi:hypothetical protein
VFPRKRLYSNEELLLRANLGLWTHVLEDFTCKQLAEIWGCSKDRAWRIQRRPNEFYGKWAFKELQGVPFLSDEMKHSLVTYLEVSDAGSEAL